MAHNEAANPAAAEHDDRIEQIIQLARQLSVAVEYCDQKALAKLADNTSHQGVVLEYRDKGPGDEKSLNRHLSDGSGSLVLLLDGVQDPHNLGACLRSAAAMAVDALVLPKDNAVALTPVAMKVAAGGSTRVPLFRVTNLARVIGGLQQRDFWVYGAAGDAPQELAALDMNGPVALVMGAEGSGMRARTRKSCDTLFRIPMPGEMESLNVSVATGVALYEVARQRAATR